MSTLYRLFYTIAASALFVVPFLTYAQQEVPENTDTQVLCNVTTLVYDEYINAQLDYQEALNDADYARAATALSTVHDLRSEHCTQAGPFVSIQPSGLCRASLSGHYCTSLSAVEGLVHSFPKEVSTLVYAELVEVLNQGRFP